MKFIGRNIDFTWSTDIFVLLIYLLVGPRRAAP